MQNERYPILEFDEDKNALIRPFHIFKPMDIAERCVLCNFGEAIEKILEEFPHKVVTYFKAGSIKLPIYELEYKGKKILRSVKSFMLATAWLELNGIAVIVVEVSYGRKNNLVWR